MNLKKIIVNTDACIGCGACVAIDPEHFAFNDEGLSMAISTENLESSNVNSAIDSCPTSAISITENEIEDKEEENCSDCCHDCCHCNCEED